MPGNRRHGFRRQQDRELGDAIFELANGLQTALVQVVTLRAAYGDRDELVVLHATLQRCVDALRHLQPPAGV